MSQVLKFPDGFKWGSATSAHQVEGNNHNDWSEWEKSRPPSFISGKAADSYNRYEEDFSIAKELNQNIHRFSIEWSRIEPEEGKFNEKEMEHYKRLIDALRERGIEPMVTLWHFTNPIWFAEKGGWLNRKAPEYFTRYAKYVVDNLKDRVGLWITFNEATTVYGSHAYFLRKWPPQYRNIFKWMSVNNNFIKAHVESYKEIKKIYGCSLSGLNDKNSLNPNQPKSAPSPYCMSHNVEVGLVERNTWAFGGNRFYEKVIKSIYRYANLYFWTRAFPYYDFMGLNYYEIERYVPGSYRVVPKQNWWMEEMNWEIYPKAIYHTVNQLKKFKKPIYITENGTADAKDVVRKKFIEEHLRWVWQAIQDGADIRGYLYWSLLDNFEFDHGYNARFGLVEIDYATFERRVRPSAHEYAKICLTNQLEVDL